MNQPLPPPPTDPAAPPSEPPVLKVKSSSRGVLYGVLACVALFVIFIVVVAVASSGSKSPGVTFASSTEAPAPTTAAPSTQPPTTAPPPHTPTPDDFALEVIETSRSCFGSAGCNIQYKINPTYTGPPVDSSKSYTIIYEVTGAEDLKTDNFTMRGDKWTGSSEDFISAPTGAVLAAKVTRVV